MVKQNENLAQNISSLFNTAKAEIARKDKWIGDLRCQVEKEDKRLHGDARR